LEQIHFLEFFSARINGLYYMTHGGLGLRKYQFNRDGYFFFKGYGEAPNVRKRTHQMQIHTFIEMARFLHLIDSQKIQVSVILNQRPIMSAIIKTNRHALEWIETQRGRIKDATIDVDLPLKFRLKVRIETASVWGACPTPMHGPHAFSIILAPALIR
jgi:hypothetical protein